MDVVVVDDAAVGKHGVNFYKWFEWKKFSSLGKFKKCKYIFRNYDYERHSYHVGNLKKFRNQFVFHQENQRIVLKKYFSEFLINSFKRI